MCQVAAAVTGYRDDELIDLIQAASRKRETCWQQLRYVRSEHMTNGCGKGVSRSPAEKISLRLLSASGMVT